MNRHLLALAALLAAAACAQQVSPLGRSNNNRIATELAGPATYLGQLPVAFVVLRPDSSNPASVDTPRNRELCQAFIELPTAASIEARDAVAANIVRTRWLVTDRTVAPPAAMDCGFLLQHYDLPRANAITSNVELTRGSFVGPGPFLVVIDGKNVTAVDGSYETDMGKFAQSWTLAVNRMQEQINNRPRGSHLIDAVLALPRMVLKVLELIFPPTRIITGTLKGIVC